MRRSKLLAGVACVGLLVTLTACGDDDESSAPPASEAPSSASASNAPTGSPINVMTIAPEGTATANYPGVPIIAKAYAKIVNDRGGINGRPLNVLVCNDRNDPNTAATCARQAVSEKAVAVLGSFSLGSGQALPVLEAAGIPWLGNYALNPTEYTSKDSYPLVAGPLAFLASGVQAGKDEACTKISLVSFDIPAGKGLIPFIDQGVKSQQKSIANTIPVPPTTTDFSSIVAGAKDSACVITSLPDAQIQAYLGKAKSLGIKQRVYAPGGALAGETLKTFADIIEGSGTPSAFTATDEPAWASFKEAIKDDAEKIDVYNIQNQNAWVAYTVLDKVASTVTGELTAATFKAALDKATAVDTGGLTPPLNFTKPFPVPQLARLMHSQLIPLKVEGGKLVKAGEFEDYAQYFTG